MVPTVPITKDHLLATEPAPEMKVAWYSVLWPWLKFKLQWSVYLHLYLLPLVHFMQCINTIHIDVEQAEKRRSLHLPCPSLAMRSTWPEFNTSKWLHSTPWPGGCDVSLGGGGEMKRILDAQLYSPIVDLQGQL